MNTTTIYARIEFFYNLARSSFHAVYSVFLFEYGLNIEDMASLRIIFFASIIFLELPTGMLADRIGRSISVKMSTLFIAVGYSFYFFGNSFFAFTIAVILTGFGFALYSGSLEAWAVDALHAENDNYSVTHMFAKGKRQGTAGMIIGAFVGAIIASVYLKGIWLLGIAGMLVTFAILVFTVHEPTHEPRESVKFSLGNMVSELKRGVKHPLPLSIMMGVGFLIFFFNQPSFLYWQIYFKSLLNLDKVGLVDPNQPALGLAYLGMLTATMIGARLVPIIKHPPKRVLLLSGLVMALPYLLLNSTDNFSVVIVIYIISYFARGVFEPTFRALLNSHIYPQFRASLISLSTLISRLGSITALVILSDVASKSIGKSLSVAGLVFVCLFPILMLVYKQLETEGEARERQYDVS